MRKVFIYKAYGCIFIDTLEQAKKIRKKSEVYNYQLWSLCDDYGITIADEHSALFDSYATGKLFLNLVYDKQETMPSEIYKSLKS